MRCCFTRLAVTRRSAVLELARKAVTKVVVLEKGMPVECRSNLNHETLGQVLVDREMITDEQRQRCLNQSVSGERHLGKILIDHALITPSDLFRTLQQTLAGSCFIYLRGEAAPFGFAQASSMSSRLSRSRPRS